MESWISGLWLMGGGGGSGRLPIHSVKPKLVLGLRRSRYRLQESRRRSPFSIRRGFKSDKYLAKGESAKQEIFPLRFPSTLPFLFPFISHLPPFCSPTESGKSLPLRIYGHQARFPGPNWPHPSARLRASLAPPKPF